MHPERATKVLSRRVARSGLPPIRLHDLRHTWATLAPQAGAHPRVVSDRLGHSSIGVTLDVYSHAIPALQARPAETVATMVLGTVSRARGPDGAGFADCDCTAVTCDDRALPTCPGWDSNPHALSGHGF